MILQYIIYGLSPFVANYLTNKWAEHSWLFYVLFCIAIILMTPIWVTDYSYTYFVFEIIGRFTFFLALLGILFSNMKWSKFYRKIKNTIIILSIIISLTITTIVFFATAMGTRTTIVNEWKINNYTIIHRSSIAWAGPPTEHIYLNKSILNGLLYKTVGYLHQSDFPNEGECILRFKNHTFNKCSKTIINKYE